MHFFSYMYRKKIICPLWLIDFAVYFPHFKSKKFKKADLNYIVKKDRVTTTFMKSGCFTRLVTPAMTSVTGPVNRQNQNVFSKSTWQCLNLQTHSKWWLLRRVVAWGGLYFIYKSVRIFLILMQDNKWQYLYNYFPRYSLKL